MVVELMATHQLSERRACGLIGITRCGFRHAPAEDRNRALRQRLRALAEERRRWGCSLLYRVIRREGFAVNSHKRVERLYGKKDCRCAGGGDEAAGYVRVVREQPRPAPNGLHSQYVRG